MAIEVAVKQKPIEEDGVMVKLEDLEEVQTKAESVEEKQIGIKQEK